MTLDRISRRKPEHDSLPWNTVTELELQNYRKPIESIEIRDAFVRSKNW